MDKIFSIPEVVAMDIEDINPTLERMLRPYDGNLAKPTDNTFFKQYHHVKRNGLLGARLTYVTGDEFMESRTAWFD